MKCSGGIPDEKRQADGSSARGEPLGHTPALGCPWGRSIVTISADGPKAGKPGALEGQWEFRGSDSAASCQLHSAPLSTCCQAAVAELRSGEKAGQHRGWESRVGGLSLLSSPVSSPWARAGQVPEPKGKFTLLGFFFFPGENTWPEFLKSVGRRLALWSKIGSCGFSLDSIIYRELVQVT